MLTVDYEKFELRAGDLLLDLGCGFGRHTYEALVRGAHVVSCDMAMPELEAIKNTAPMLIDDGLFDIVEVSGMSRRRLLPTLAKVFKGRHLRVAGVECSRATSVSLRPINERAELLLEVDGEQAGRLPARFDIVPSGLRLRICTSSS